MLAVSWMTWSFLGGLAIVVAIAVLTRTGWLKIFGPVLFYEIIRASRRGRYFWVRALYAMGLFLLFLWIYTLWSYDHRRTMKAQDQTQLGEVFFYTYAIVQFIAVVLLTPGYVGGCIADDKERRTIEFLLATDLANREIIFGKLFARVGNLFLFLITGLPVLSMIQFYGGIDPAILLLIFAATALTMLGLVGISMVQSVQRRRVRDAIIVSYLIAIAYVGVCQMLWIGQQVLPRISGTWFHNVLSQINPAIDVFRWGDPVRTMYEVVQVMSGSGAHGDAYLRILREYASFHLLVFALGIAYAIWKVRAIALRQAGGGEVKKGKRVKKIRRPPVSLRRPMVWKEVHVEGKIRVGWLGRIGLYLLIAIGFVPLGIMLYIFTFEARGMSMKDLHEGIDVWVRCMNVPISCLMLLGIAVRAAGSIGGERDRDTLISLLTTPLDSGEIVGGKFWGALASVRKLGILLAVVWAIGLVSYSVHPVGVILQIVAMIPPACLAASMGLFFSTWCRTTLRSLMTTLLAMVYVLGGHWIVGLLCCFMPLGLMGGGFNDGMKYLWAFEVGATPPAVFALVPVQYGEDWFRNDKDMGAVVTMGVFGMLSWLVIAAVIGRASLERFALMTNRIRRKVPAAMPGLLESVQ